MSCARRRVRARALARDAGRGSRWVRVDSFERDFGERDKLVLDTLQPHLLQLWRNAAARRRDSRSLAALTPREREILLWVARTLDNVYDKLGVSNRAGAVGHALSIERETFADQ